MDLQSMLKREEEFFECFFYSISRYFKLIYDIDIELLLTDRNNTASMCIYPRLSAAASKNISKRAEEFFYSEWNIRDNCAKRYLMKLYVFIMLASRGVLAQYKIATRPHEVISHDIVIAPNNRSIRVFDYSNNTVGCIVKQGFTSKYFCNQLEFRKQHDYTFLLPLIAYGEDWYTEPILHGHPLARETNKKKYKSGLKDAVNYIGMLARDTINMTNAKAYVEDLKEYLLQRLHEAYEKKHITEAVALEKTVLSLARPIDESEAVQIPIVMSHGDFQGGNIWIESSGKVWLYDWETVEERSIWYDAATLMLSTRRVGGLEKLWSERKNPTTMAVVMSNDEDKDCSTKRMDMIARIIILEDIKFYIDDMLELPKDWGRNIFISFIARLRGMGIDDE